MENERLVRSLKNRIIEFAKDHDMRALFIEPYSDYYLVVFRFEYDEGDNTYSTPYCIISKYSTDLRKSLYDTFELVLKNNPILKQNRETLDVKRELIDITFNRNDIAKLLIGDELRINNANREIVIRMEE
jgi:hypothetical protein